MDKAAILVLIVSTSKCSLDTTDEAQSHHIPMASLEECQAVAEVADPKQGITAYCEPRE